MSAPFEAPASYGLSNGSPPFPSSRLLGIRSPSPWTALDELNPAVLFPAALPCDSSSLSPDVCLGHLDFLFAASKTPAAMALSQPDLHPLPIPKPVHSLLPTFPPGTRYIQSP